MDRRWQKLIHEQKVMEIVFNYQTLTFGGQV